MLYWLKIALRKEGVMEKIGYLLIKIGCFLACALILHICFWAKPLHLSFEKNPYFTSVFLSFIFLMAIGLFLYVADYYFWKRSPKTKGI